MAEGSGADLERVCDDLRLDRHPRRPTIISGIYGMNFVFMPELGWVFGYPFSLLLMATTSALLYLRSKRSGWL